ncbi:DNA repair protein [Lentibacillus kapialis]|uniref:DNA repair protein n=1 Tax=Lentibacillus kapialis TaxID=340214 RepID=A0A917PTM1_9BACI|nr:BREX-1 system phosphatase PglZ type A [Lentibacillus kapialis]GGJ91370.1 DNA repair protein [Lentibacillus kapialis]
MNLNEVHRVLNDYFQKELTNGKQRHVVFWYDEEDDFKEEIESIDLPGVRVWQVTPNNLFATKYELEKNDPASHFLLYANMPRPNPHDDWLLDIYKTGFEFATDKITVIMRELGVTDDSLRETLKRYKAFFNNKNRLLVFRKYPVDMYTQETIDLTVLAALTKSRTNTMDDIIRTLMRKWHEGDESVWEAIRKYGDTDRFWELAEKYYGYTLREKSLQSLLIFFILTYATQYQMNSNIPESWQAYISPRPANTIVFMDQWMNHVDDRPVFNSLVDQMEDVLNVRHYAKEWDITDIVQMDGFRLFDESIIDYLATQLINQVTDFDTYDDMIAARRIRHWYPEYKYEYEALHHAIKLLRLIHEREPLIPEQSVFDMFHAYAGDYYQADTAYRKFYTAYDRIEHKERLHQVRDMIENVYANRFMDELAVKWAGSLEKSDNKEWAVSGLPQQHDFYRDWVKPHRERDERVFVIVSDALRYEVACELSERLNNERKASANISAIQGVLPSYTAVGMAALLPHRIISFARDGAVTADGLNTKGTPHRDDILKQNVPASVAVQFDEVIGLNRQAFRETFQGKKVIYIYHNTIDAQGDNATTEKEVFEAAEDAIKDIRSLVNRLVVDLTAANILITADHGFLYQRDALERSQKTPQSIDESILAKRRFLITETPTEMEGTLSFPLDYLFDEEIGWFVTVPQGVNRFAIPGPGANFVHGGAMPQEVVLPVIEFKNDRSRSSRNQASKVDVRLTTPARKVTSPVMYLAFLQMVRVEEKQLPRRLKLYFADIAGERVTNENIIIADSTAVQPSERTFREKFVFKDMAYNRRETYYLVLEDEQTEEVYERYPFTVDIAFMDG